MRLSRFSRAHAISFPTPKWRFFLCQRGWGIWEESNRQAQYGSTKEVLGFFRKVGEEDLSIRGLGIMFLDCMFWLYSNYFLMILYAPQVSTKVASIQQPYITRRRYMFFLETFLQSSIFPLWWNCCACQTHPNERCSLALNCKQCISGLRKLMRYQSVCEDRGEQQPCLEQVKLVFAPVKRGLPCLNRGYRTPDPSPSPSPVSKCLGLPVAHIWQDIWPKYPSDSIFSQWYSLWVVMMFCGGGLDLSSLCVYHVIGLPWWLKFRCKSSLNTQWPVKVRAAAQSSTLWPRILFVTVEAPKSAWTV